MELTELSDRELKDSYNERMVKLAQLRRNPVERWKVQRELRRPGVAWGGRGWVDVCHGKCLVEHFKWF